MSRSKKPQVSFSLPSEPKKEELEAYARAKGFASVGALARFALFQYIGRYPLKGAQGRTALGYRDKKKMSGMQ